MSTVTNVPDSGLVGAVRLGAVQTQCRKTRQGLPYEDDLRYKLSEE